MVGASKSCVDVGEGHIELVAGWGKSNVGAFEGLAGGDGCAEFGRAGLVPGGRIAAGDV